MSDKANVLVMGNSGSGKSTLINAVFNFSSAEVGFGKPVTKRMTIYETDEMSFRAIDTKGLEYGILEQIRTKNEIKKWSKASVKNQDEAKYIHLIWYCVDATSKRFSRMDLDLIKKVAVMWKNIPIIIVLTKSYSESETAENIQMIEDSRINYKDTKHLNIAGIVPVVAKLFPINNETIIAPVGLDRLVSETNDILPEAFRITNEAVRDFSLRIKRANAIALVVTVSSGAALIGAVPIAFPDAAILVPLQSGLIFGIARIYGVDTEEEIIRKIKEVIIGTGTITIAAKAIIKSLKTIPGLALAASVINAVVAAVITAVIGEVAIVIMEKIVKKEIDVNDLEWIKGFAATQFMKRVGKYIERLGKNLEGKDPKKIGELITDTLREFFI